MLNMQTRYEKATWNEGRCLTQILFSSEQPLSNPYILYVTRSSSFIPKYYTLLPSTIYVARSYPTRYQRMPWTTHFTTIFLNIGYFEESKQVYDTVIGLSAILHVGDIVYDPDRFGAGKVEKIYEVCGGYVFFKVEYVLPDRVRFETLAIREEGFELDTYGELRKVANQRQLPLYPIMLITRPEYACDAPFFDTPLGRNT